MHFRDDLDSHHFPPFGNSWSNFGHHRYGLVLFMGQYLTEPANAAGHGQDGAQGTHGRAGHETRKE